MYMPGGLSKQERVDFYNEEMEKKKEREEEALLKAKEKWKMRLEESRKGSKFNGWLFVVTFLTSAILRKYFPDNGSMVNYFFIFWAWMLQLGAFISLFEWYGAKEDARKYNSYLNDKPYLPGMVMRFLTSITNKARN